MFNVACPSRDELLAYLVGRVAGQAAESLAEHIETCSECLSTLATLDDAEDALVASLRRPDVEDEFRGEPQCQAALFELVMNMPFGSTDSMWDDASWALLDVATHRLEEAWDADPEPRLANFVPVLETDPRHSRMVLGLIKVDQECRRKRGGEKGIDQYLAEWRKFGDSPELLSELRRAVEQQSGGSSDPGRRTTLLAQPDPQSPTPNAPRACDPERLLPEGHRLEHYVIRGVLGQGAMGTVYLAYDEGLDQQVAIKVPRRGKFASEGAMDRLLAEARAVVKLKHPGIVSVHYLGRDALGNPFIVMDYIEGISLEKQLAAQRPEPARAVELMIQIAEAVHHAHKKGFVHRDLKPANILLDKEGKPHIADFGLAIHETVQHLETGEVAGSPAYMSPEQFRGEADRLDGRTDVWALGVILYEMLTGRQPFLARNAIELRKAVLAREPKPPRVFDEKIPADLEQICCKCLSKTVTGRYGTAYDLARELRRSSRKDESARGKIRRRAFEWRREIGARLLFGRFGCAMYFTVTAASIILASLFLLNQVPVGFDSTNEHPVCYVGPSPDQGATPPKGPTQPGETRTFEGRLAEIRGHAGEIHLLVVGVAGLPNKMLEAFTHDYSFARELRDYRTDEDKTTPPRGDAVVAEVAVPDARHAAIGFRLCSWWGGTPVTLGELRSISRKDDPGSRAVVGSRRPDGSFAEDRKLSALAELMRVRPSEGSTVRSVGIVDAATSSPLYVTLRPPERMSDSRRESSLPDGTREVHTTSTAVRLVCPPGTADAERLRQAKVVSVEAVARSVAGTEQLEMVLVRWECLLSWSLKARANEALPELEKLLNDTSSDVRVAAAKALAGMGPDAVPHLQKALADEDSRVRTAAIDGLAAMGQGAKGALPEVRKAIGDEDPNIRRKAIACWVKLESDPQKLVAGLLPALGDADPGVSSMAQETLGKAPLDAKVVMPVLLEALQRRDDRQDVGVCHVVKRLGADAKQAAPFLAAKLREMEVAMARFGGTTAQQAEPPLVAKLREGSDVKNLAILEALVAIGPDAKEAAPSIVRALDFEDSRVRRAAVLALKTFRPPEKELVGMLVNKALYGREPVRLAALEALKAFGPEAADTAPALVHLALHDREEPVRLAALEALKALGPEAADAAPALVRLALRNRKEVGRLATETLWTVLGSMDARAKGTLEKLLRDDDPEVRVWALVAYIRRGPVEESLPAVVEALKDKDKTVHEQALEALPQVITQALSSSDQDIRLQAIKLVARLGPNARNMLSALERVKDDARSSREVREAATAAVRRFAAYGSMTNPAKPARKTPPPAPRP